MDAERRHEIPRIPPPSLPATAQPAEADEALWSRALAVAFEAVNDAVVVFDKTGRLITLNAAARTHLGLDSRPNANFMRQSIGERALQLDLRDEHGRPISQEQWVPWRLLNGETLTGANALEVVIHTLDGRELQSSVTGAPVRDETGHIIGAVMITRDVTERQLLLLAQEEDRRRVAYEVHDGLAQIAASAHQHLQAFARRHRLRSVQARQDFARVLELVRQTVTEARHVVANLRPTLLDDAGLAPAIRLQVEELRSVGWQITYRETLGAARLPAAVETALFRISQEALTNVRKHARTTQVHIALERAGPLVRLLIRDEGCGFVPEAVPQAVGAGERLGLVGMRERVALLSGCLTVQSRPGAGACIIAEVPLLIMPPESSTHGR